MDSTEDICQERVELEHCLPEQDGRNVALYGVAVAFHNTFQEERGFDDLNEAITSHRAALESQPLGNHKRSSTLDLAACLSKRYDRQGIVADLEEAITLSRAVLALCPPGHPDRGISFSNLARDLWKRFPKQADTPGLHTANSVYPAASAICLTSHADVPSLLFQLSLHFWDRFQRQATLTDLDEAICLATYVLELRPPGHCDYAVSLERLTLFVGERAQRLAQRTSSDEVALLGQAVDNLTVLANYFRDRSGHQNATVDLKEAITLYRYVLQFRPTGHPSRASSLCDLAQCLAEQFRQQSNLADLEEAIALQQEVLQLLASEDPRYAMSQRCLMAYLQLKISSNVAMTPSLASAVTHVDIKQAVRNIAFETLKTMPTRLLQTRTGVLCNRDAQILHFMSSQQYSQLLSSCATCNPVQQMTLIRTVTSRYFQYVMLSHRWGEGEPSLRDVEGHKVYGMSTNGGLGKLQAFCLVACDRGYLWAWSDTCCIDKNSSAELQEAIGSMFAWYRRSSLTIVYLSDVSETGSLGNSEWFRRGWTLQELLAPQTVLFYTQNWSLYKNLTSSNHKADVAVLEELERATGIEPGLLINFSPDMGNARLRLQWASLRRTTRPEDIAYSLFGIFNLHLPVLYGESAEHSLGRLLAEIVSQSGDISVLDWVGEASQFHSCFPAQIISYHNLPLPPLHSSAEEQPSTMSSQPTSFKTLRKSCGSLATSLLTRLLTPSRVVYRVPAVRLRTSDPYARNGVYDFHSLNKVPLPRFINRRLILPCVAHRIAAFQLKRADPHVPRYTYEIQACGLRPLEVALPSELENTTISQGALQLVRPWHSKLLGPSTKLYATIKEQLLFTLGRPFNALLLTELPHNEYKRIASSTLIIAQPVSRASVLKSTVRIFDIV
ncbi:hypothetical protein F5J12DRAFT_913099 [Pisolithus orientalis]|uniref:uncharacterized protein n=1 Tax=Pisolithus orientalis TaxID=936130 RepID=UPI002224F55E|nr:uncharacterized protein F5J12DRAFT_913099 [Pisolithus orientalis]KAI6006545.1 hypothetical protein F5J12DRAFT_913099 [Pisolithus orientalis]